MYVYVYTIFKILNKVIIIQQKMYGDNKKFIYKFIIFKQKF